MCAECDESIDSNNEKQSLHNTIQQSLPCDMIDITNYITDYAYTINQCPVNKCMKRVCYHCAYNVTYDAFTLCNICVDYGMYKQSHTCYLHYDECYICRELIHKPHVHKCDRCRHIMCVDCLIPSTRYDDSEDVEYLIYHEDDRRIKRIKSIKTGNFLCKYCLPDYINKLYDDIQSRTRILEMLEQLDHQYEKQTK